MIPTRAVLALVLVLAILFVARLYRARKSRAAAADVRPDAHPLVPDAVRAGAERTWVLFTSPYCANCGPVEERLRASDPGARVVRVDATREPLLAKAFNVRSAPTAVLADADGRVQTRLVGPDAVERWALSRR
ncbi:MAG TPA: thioredoxin family protein [Acidimicrobiales bacterium]|nr:thioredoxin family protein [Acidimicrobiales bacterium]